LPQKYSPPSGEQFYKCGNNGANNTTAINKSQTPESGDNLKPRVEAIYKQKDKLDHIDRQALAMPQGLVLNMTTGSLKDWIS
jgi:hypothetical protein